MEDLQNTEAMLKEQNLTPAPETGADKNKPISDMEETNQNGDVLTLGAAIAQDANNAPALEPTEATDAPVADTTESTEEKVDGTTDTPTEEEPAEVETKTRETVTKLFSDAAAYVTAIVKAIVAFVKGLIDNAVETKSRTLFPFKVSWAAGYRPAFLVGNRGIDRNHLDGLRALLKGSGKIRFTVCGTVTPLLPLLELMAGLPEADRLHFYDILGNEITLDIPGMKALAKTYPYTLAVMMSPTGTGVKVFVLTDLKDPSRHSDLYHHLGDIMGFKSRIDLKFDPSCSNPSRACFFSCDSKMYLNPDARPFHVDLESLPVYTPPVKTPGASTAPTIRRTDIAFDDITFPAPLVDEGQIRNAIKDSHSLFEATHPMFQGVRNTNLFTLAFFFRLDGIPEDAATDYLVAYYVDPAGGFLADEIKRTVRSAYSR